MLAMNVNRIFLREFAIENRSTKPRCEATQDIAHRALAFVF